LSDLLNANDPNATKLRMREDSHDGVYVEGLTEHIIKSPQDIIDLLRRGSSARVSASTNMNQSSSRSHAVFSIIVEHSTQVATSAASGSGSSNAATVTVGRLNMVDLAGSERVKTTGITAQQRLQELTKINASLTAFGRA
jgi:hypothetical protein